MCLTIRQKNKITIVSQIFEQNFLGPLTKIVLVSIESIVSDITSKPKTINTLEHMLTLTIVNLRKVDTTVRILRHIRRAESRSIYTVRSDKKFFIFDARHHPIHILNAFRQTEYIWFDLSECIQDIYISIKHFRTFKISKVTCDCTWILNVRNDGNKLIIMNVNKIRSELIDLINNLTTIFRIDDLHFMSQFLQSILCVPDKDFYSTPTSGRDRHNARSNQYNFHRLPNSVNNSMCLPVYLSKTAKSSGYFLTR